MTRSRPGRGARPPVGVPQRLADGVDEGLGGQVADEGGQPARLAGEGPEYPGQEDHRQVGQADHREGRFCGGHHDGGRGAEGGPGQGPDGEGGQQAHRCARVHGTPAIATPISITTAPPASASSTVAAIRPAK